MSNRDTNLRTIHDMFVRNGLEYDQWLAETVAELRQAGDEATVLLIIQAYTVGMSLPWPDDPAGVLAHHAHNMGMNRISQAVAESMKEPST